jgi:hypothetical protein
MEYITLYYFVEGSEFHEKLRKAHVRDLSPGRAEWMFEALQLGTL